MERNDKYNVTPVSVNNLYGKCTTRISCLTSGLMNVNDLVPNYFHTSRMLWIRTTIIITTIHYWDQAKQINEMKREGNNEKKITNDHNCKIE